MDCAEESGPCRAPRGKPTGEAFSGNASASLRRPDRPRCGGLSSTFTSEPFYRFEGRCADATVVCRAVFMAAVDSMAAPRSARSRSSGSFGPTGTRRPTLAAHRRRRAGNSSFGVSGRSVAAGTVARVVSRRAPDLRGTTGGMERARRHPSSEDAAAGHQPASDRRTQNRSMGGCLTAALPGHHLASPGRLA